MGGAVKRRKVKSGRFLDQTEAEKQLKAKLDPKVDMLRQKLEDQLTESIRKSETERTKEAQGIMSADREARLATMMNASTASDISLPAQLASNAIADATTGRRLGTSAEVQSRADVAKSKLGVETIDEKGELKKTQQDARVDLAQGVAKESGDIAKQGAIYGAVGGFTSGALSRLNQKSENPVEGVSYDARGNIIPVTRPAGTPYTDFDLGKNIFSQPGTELSRIDYSGRSNVINMETPRSQLAFTVPQRLGLYS